MSNIVYPSLLGQDIVATRAPAFATKVKRAVSGKEFRAAFMAYPLWNLSISYEFLRDGNRGADLQTIEGLFMQMRGAWDSFLVAVLSDFSVTDMPFGVGNGAQTAFQLTRTRGAGGFSFVEPVQNVNAITNVKKNGVTLTLTTDYTVGSTGIVTFVSAPAGGAALTWTGTYYFRCRFVRDEMESERFLADLWKLGKVELLGAPGNRL